MRDSLVGVTGGCGLWNRWREIRLIVPRTGDKHSCGCGTFSTGALFKLLLYCTEQIVLEVKRGRGWAASALLFAMRGIINESSSGREPTLQTASSIASEPAAALRPPVCCAG